MPTYIFAEIKLYIYMNFQTGMSNHAFFFSYIKFIYYDPITIIIIKIIIDLLLTFGGKERKTEGRKKGEG